MGKTVKAPATVKKKKSPMTAKKHSSPIIKELMQELKVESEGEPRQAWEKGINIECAKDQSE